jgi:hypothetical protein
MNLSEAWQKNYLDTYQRIEEDLIKGLKKRQPELLSLVSPQNKIAFKQLLDIDIAFAKYIQSVDSFSFSILNLLINLKNEINDPKLDKLILEVKPLLESAINDMSKKSQGAHDCIAEFSRNAFMYIEKNKY